MRLLRFTSLFLGCGAIAAPLTVERIASASSIAGTAPSSPTWSPDSRRLAFMWSSEGEPRRGLWVADLAGGEPRQLIADEVTALVWAADGASLFFVSGGNIHRVSATGGPSVRLTSDGGDRSDLHLSPDGTTLSYLREGDLWLLPAAGGIPERVTHVAIPPIAAVPLGRYYHYDVEIGPPSWGEHPAAIWSAEGRYLAVHYVDRRGVRKVPFPWYLGDEPILNFLRRGAPGQANELRTIGILDVQTRQLRLLDLPDQTSSRVIEFSFSPKGPLLVDRQSDDCVNRVIQLADPATGTLREIWRDHGDRRIYNEVASTWAADGDGVLMTGDLDDRYRLYLLEPGKAPRALTRGPYDVEGKAIPVAATRSVVYVSSEPSPSERHVWRIPETGGEPVRLSAQPGQNTPFVSPDGSALALLHSDDRTPMQLQLDGRALTRPPPEFARQQWAAVRYATFPGPGGIPLHARILQPSKMDKSKKYPVLLGPVYINTVRNRWADRPLYGLLPQLLVQRGYLVVQIDMRGSTGYGREFREKFLMDWGGGDLDDLESAVAYLKSLPYVDGKRVGIFGSSYGGLLAVYSLFRKPGLFAAGVAGAPATEPRWFGSDDVAIARTPQAHPETFARGAARYASGLRDHLLIIHGMADDVVPFKTSVDLAEELIKLGKDFDFVISPSATHAWDKRPDTAAYLFRKLVEHFDRHLGVK